MNANKTSLDKLIESTSEHWPTLTPKARAELAQLRADLNNVTAERDALAAESDAMHRAVNKMCGTDTSTIEAVQHIISERDAARAELASNKVYQRMAARR